MPAQQPKRIKTITEFHRFRGLPGPEHPLISVIDYKDIVHHPDNNTTSWVLDFYSISLKRNPAAKIKYGRQEYDFDEGVMFFMAPEQSFSIEIKPGIVPKHEGWMLLVHPDFLWNTALANGIKHYGYFDYEVNEALFLSEKEEATLNGIVKNIQQEYHSNIDGFSKNVIIAQIELLLTYADRFYHRQFITRKITNHTLVEKLDDLLTAYFNDPEIKGLPGVQYVADRLNVSPGYLSDLLRVQTGMNTQQHIHEKLIRKAKQKLSETKLTVSEIAYELGFEHPQSFSKLFKTKTDLSPLEFRRGFN